MMYSAIMIALTIACSNGVGGHTMPTTVIITTPYTSPPPQECNVYGNVFAIGDTYEDKHAGNEMCRVYECGQYGSYPPFAYSHFECYDSTTDKCVTFYSTQMKDGCERVCEPYTGYGGPGWVPNGCDTTAPTTTPPPPTTTTPPLTTTTPPLTTTQGCTFGGEHYSFGAIPNSGGCTCDNSGYVICP